MIKLVKENLGKEVWYSKSECYQVSSKLTGFLITLDGQWAFLDNDSNRRVNPNELYFSEKELFKAILQKKQEELNKFKEYYEKSFKTDSKGS